MMKSLVSATLALGLMAGIAQAQSGTADSTGCGFGTLVWKGKSGVAPQVMAVTTNGTLGSQTFGITSGTLGCTQNGVITPPDAVKLLAATNLDNLAAEIARGEGETLTSLAEAMKVDQKDQALLFTSLQNNFTRVFPSENVTADKVLASIQTVMSENQTLARYLGA